MKKHSILFLAALAVASCSKDLPEEATPGFGNGATLTLRAMNDETRTVTEDGLRFEIVENEERIGVYIQSMGYTEENVLFTAGAKDEQTGWISFDQSEPSVLKLQNGTRVLAYAPYFPNTGTITGTGEAVETDATRAEWNGIRTLTLADIQTQSAPSSVGHLPDHYAMVATPTEATSEDGVNFHADLRFSGVFAVIRIVVANPADAAADATVSKVVFSAENAALTGSFRVDLTDENPSIANDEYRPEAVDGKSYGHVTVALDTPVTLKAGEQAELFAVVNAAAVTAPKAEVYATVDGRDVVFTKEFASSYDITRRKRTSFGVKLEKASWAGKIAEPAYDEATKTYTVTEAAELAWVAQTVNAGDDFTGKTVVLAADIDLNGTEWTPIGAHATTPTNKFPFAGTFDGAGYTVSNLKVTRPDSSNAGLFGSSTGALKNVTIRNASVTGKNLVGALVGQGHNGTIENCHVQGTVRIEGNYQVGGLSGYGYARITNCSVKGDAGSYVKGTFLETDFEGDAVGGIIGYSAEHQGDSYTTVPAISSCEVEIDVAGSRKVGGIAGQVGENSNIEGCSYKGSVATNAPESYIADNPGKIMVGGIYGELTGPICRVYVKNSVVKSGTVVTGCDAKTTGIIRGGSRSSSPVFTEEGNTVEANVTLNVPMPEGIEQVGATEYKVTGATGLANFAKMVNDGDDFAGKTVVLAADIDLSGTEWTPIANCSRKDASAGFKGVFDGNGKTISGINYSNSTDDYSAGLFGVINGGTIRNLTVEGGEIGSLDSAGAICGVMLGESVIENCHNKGVNVSADSAAGGIAGRAYGSNNIIRGCTNSGAVSSAAKVAGIVGIASCAGSTTTVSECTNEGTISGKAAGGASGIVGYIGSYTEITGCHNNAAVGESGTVYAGGIVGYKQSVEIKISSCTNTAAVTGNTAGGIYGASGNNNQPVYLTGCTNSGTITGKTHAAGIAADMYAGSISECSNTGAVAAEQIAGGVAASMHTAEMSNCSGGTESVTATYAGRLIGEVATGTTTATLAIDDSNGDDYASLPTVGATSVGTSVSILTVTAGTLRGELANQSASNSVIIIAEGAAWEQYPGETGRWLKVGNATSWTKQ